MLHRHEIFLAGFALVALGQAPAPASAVTIYDNTVNEYASSGFNAGTMEHGDEVILVGSARTVVAFEFLYRLVSGQGDETARVHFFANDGPGGEPGTLLFDSGDVPLAVTGLPYAPVLLSGLSVIVPDTFTWTVIYDGTGNTVLNHVYDPPVVGSSDDSFYWSRIGSGPWTKRFFAAAPANFYAHIDAVPEPSANLLAACALLTLAMKRRRHQA